MRLLVLGRGTPLGWIEPAGVDGGMGVVFGRFHPLPAYEAVAGVFRRRAEEMPEHGPEDEAAFRRYLDARDALGLSVETEDGVRVETGWVEIQDFSTAVGVEELEAAVQLDPYGIPGLMDRAG